MSLQLARDTYARSVVRDGGASESRSQKPLVAISHPVTPHAASSPVGFVRVPHVGAWPTTTGCLCDCHGDPSSPCDVRSCLDIPLTF